MPTGSPAGGGARQEESAVPLRRLLAEALALAARIRDHLARSAPPAPDRLDEALRYSLRLSRLSTRVMAAIAWLLARRAVCAGEIDPQEGREERWRLLPLDGPAFEGPAAREDGGDPLLAELDRAAESLYARIRRLDRELDRPGQPS